MQGPSSNGYGRKRENEQRDSLDVDRRVETLQDRDRDERRCIDRDGLDKAAVRRILHTRGRWSTAQWRESWLYRTVADEARWPAWVNAAAQSGFIPVTESPDDLTLLVAGGDVPVPQHAWCPTWGYPACRIIRMIDIPDHKSIETFLMISHQLTKKNLLVVLRFWPCT